MATGRIGTTPVLRTRWSKEPAGGTTSLSGLDDNSVSLVYEVGYEAVYQNGALLSRGNDYTATDGTTITLTNATVAGDIIEVFANNVVPLTDTYSQSVADGKFVNNTIVDAKGDLIVATGADTPGRLAVGTDGQVLTAASTTGTGLTWATPASVGTWTSYTPTYYNLTIGNGTVVAKYSQTGNLCTVFWSLTYGSTTSISGGTPAVSLPANCPSAWNEVVVVAGKLEDTGTAFYLGGAMIVQPDRFRLQYFGTGGSNLTSDNVSSTAPMTWTTNDVIKVTFTYEVA